LVAVKVLSQDKVADAERKRRFIQEAKAASALNHPNIVTIYDIDSALGIDFIAVELISGKALDRLIPRHGLRLSEGLNISVQIVATLASAHKAGIVHRDLKPGNVMVNEQGLVKVLDFGLPKLTEPTATDEDEKTRSLKPTTVTLDDGYAPVESPDGRFIYYLKSLSDTDVWRISIDGGQSTAVNQLKSWRA